VNITLAKTSAKKERKKWTVRIVAIVLAAMFVIMGLSSVIITVINQAA